MAIEILRPSGNGFSDPSNAWAHEANPTFERLLTNTGDTAGVDRLYSPFLNDLRVLAIDNPTDISSGDTINEVRVNIGLRNLDPPQTSFEVVVRVGSTNYAHPTSILNTSQTYADFTRTFTVNPATSAAWTLSDIESLQVGIKKTTGMGTPWRFMEIEVDYTAGGPSGPIYKVWNGTTWINSTKKIWNGTTWIEPQITIIE